MIAQIAQVSLSALKDAVRPDYYNEATFAWVGGWTEHGGDKYVAHYPTGQACIYGPILGNKFEIQTENQATHDLIAGLSDNIGSLKGETRSGGLMRAYMATSGRELLKNSRGNTIGIMPAFGMIDPRAAFFGDEDPDEAEELDL